ncbi:MAG: guanylate kinase [Oscillospiraceae bacterium]|jgi:guanylate kinase|nr:guanylate kinase [Oscillospiraceae bacterium]MCI8714177.1 guanylate kinase [Oscillospiraceae bacterium]MCI9316488.1 guanylate kinase [Oscillospiraceae bacterium]MDE6934218.1 guanylate kinase [Oscillospiraceae bacterium]
MRKGKTFIICGPSGVGKGTVVARLLASDPSLYFSVSATTRPPRPGEEDGVHYHFLSMEQFEQWIAEDQFLEHAQFVGNRYGTPRLYVDRAMAQGRDVLLDIEIQGAEQVKRKRPDVVRIYVAPPSWAELERRLIGRGTEDMEKVRSRLARGREEFSAAKDFDYFVINDTVDRAVEELRAIMTAEHCRPEERMALIDR